jgi:hypothetical protein
MLKVISRTLIGICIFYLIFYITLFSISVVIDNSKLAFIATIVLIVLLGFSIYKFIDLYPNKIKELSERKYNELKLKENCSLFEQLYVKAYDDESVAILDKMINDNKIKHVYSLDFSSSYNRKYILFTFIIKDIVFIIRFMKIK